MGDEEDRACAAHGFDRGLHGGLGSRVERARGFVEDEDRGVGEHGARNRQALSLAAGEAQAELADFRVVALGEFRDEVVGGSRPRRRLDFRVAGVPPAVSDVLANRDVEEEGFLGHDGDPVEKGVARVVPEVDAVDLDRAPGGVVEAQEQVDQGRLSRAGPPDDRHDLAGRYLQVDAGEDRAGSVVEMHVSKRIESASPDIGRALRAIRGLFLHVEDAERRTAATAFDSMIFG